MVCALEIISLVPARHWISDTIFIPDKSESRKPDSLMSMNNLREISNSVERDFEEFTSEA